MMSLHLRDSISLQGKGILEHAKVRIHLKGIKVSGGRGGASQEKIKAI